MSILPPCLILTWPTVHCLLARLFVPCAPCSHAWILLEACTCNRLHGCSLQTLSSLAPTHVFHHLQLLPVLALLCIEQMLCTTAWHKHAWARKCQACMLPNRAFAQARILHASCAAVYPWLCLCGASPSTKRLPPPFHPPTRACHRMCTELTSRTNLECWLRLLQTAATGERPC